ncbi:MAG TPA: GspMb/PilO family protein [Thermoanaerobaculia bacterium]|nr:GspMb/PilO family protein [Thermoanaerobaculia bacterium]
MIWRERRVLLIVLAVLLLANTIFFFTYRVQYQARLDDLTERRAQTEAQLATARAQRATAEAKLASYKKIEKDVAHIYNDEWATQDARLTAMIAEIKRLGTATGLVPAAYSFDQSEAKGELDKTQGATTAAKKSVGAKEVGVSFTVDGNYEQIRRLINLFELSNQFMIIDQVALASRSGDSLSLRLHVKTLFRDTEHAGTNHL